MFSETPMNKKSQKFWLEGTPEGHLVPPSGAIAMLDQVSHSFAYPLSAWLLLSNHIPACTEKRGIKIHLLDKCFNFQTSVFLDFWKENQLQNASSLF